MRLRVGLLLCLFAIITVVGCRKPLAPNIDRNRAPETWITAAPFDTITFVRGERPRPGDIPIRFHLYWAGGDRDGAVVGYYWAVVETLPLPPDGGSVVPTLPGPAPGDYRYTTRTDSTFIFTVAEDLPDRQHAFFIYAVDDKGKPDPTPARFIFNARDDFPPRPIFDAAFATGRVYYFYPSASDPNRELRDSVGVFPITDIADFNTLTRDAVPSGSRLTFRFHAELTVPGSVVKGFRYKLDEAELQPSHPDSLFHGNTVEYRVPPGEADPGRAGLDTLPVANGVKVFRLRAVDQANGSEDSTRRFQMNFSPETWFAGPDPNLTGGPWQPTNALGEKFALLVNGRPPAGGLPGTLLSPDSVQIMPVDREPRKTFLEIYKDTVFIRREFDTVHLGSWVVVHNGGFDRDSPYRVNIAQGIPGYPSGPVLTPGGANGSPIGFLSLIPIAQTPDGSLAFTNQSLLYPFFDNNDPHNFQRIGAYHSMGLSGRAYSLQRAEDGDGGRDGRVGQGSAHTVAENPSPDPILRPLVLVYEVNFPPVLQTDHIQFRPRVASVDTFTSRSWELHLFNGDRDPFTSGEPVGGPGSQTNRMRFKITGLHRVGGRDTMMTTYEPPLGEPPLGGPQNRYHGIVDEVRLPVPDNLLTGPVTLNVELCDCEFCELNAGTGRCINRDFQVYYVCATCTAPTSTPSRPGLD